MLIEQYLTSKEPQQDDFLMPDPNLHKIISNWKWMMERGRLDTAQIKSLKRGKSFIEAARRGLEISRRAINEQAIEGDKSDFRIYKISEAAMGKYMQEQSLPLDDIIDSVESVLDQLIEKHGRGLEGKNKKRVEMASQFFENVSSVHWDLDSSHSKEIFPTEFF